MVTNGQLQIANGMRSDGRPMGSGRLEVPAGPAGLMSWRAAPGREPTTPAPVEDLEIWGPG